MAVNLKLCLGKLEPKRANRIREMIVDYALENGCTQIVCSDKAVTFNHYLKFLKRAYVELGATWFDGQPTPTGRIEIGFLRVYLISGTTGDLLKYYTAQLPIDFLTPELRTPTKADKKLSMNRIKM